MSTPTNLKTQQELRAKQSIRSIRKFAPFAQGIMIAIGILLVPACFLLFVIVASINEVLGFLLFVPLLTVGILLLLLFIYLGRILDAMIICYAEITENIRYISYYSKTRYDQEKSLAEATNKENQ